MPVLVVDPQAPEPAAIARAAAIIQGGGLVAFPTETVYGLGANALDGAAVGRLFAAKGRPTNDPVIVHIAAFDQLARVAAAVPPTLRRLAAAFWPGPLTVIVPKAPRVPSAVTAGLPNVAVRMPSHAVALALIQAAGVPIAAPSANRFGHVSPTTAQHVIADLAGQVDLILDGGPTAIGVESTVLDLTAEPPAILRPGGVSLEEIRTVLGADVRGAAPAGVGRAREPLQAPGMMLKHYAPRSPLTLFAGPSDAVRRRLAAEAARLAAEGKRVGLLVAAEDLPALSAAPGAVVEAPGSLDDLPAVARNLFGAVRRLDAAGVDAILARSFGTRGLGAAIEDRLVRAAAGHVIHVDDATSGRTW
ncbi:MAG: threonylcarbamoyl-AMP synthase [Chloroflexi bacterium]|nr:threonylcarbamoyl-AMP synthase [Chloroflexota bacterium]